MDGFVDCFELVFEMVSGVMGLFRKWNNPPRDSQPAVDVADRALVAAREPGIACRLKPLRIWSFGLARRTRAVANHSPPVLSVSNPTSGDAPIARTAKNRVILPARDIGFNEHVAD